MRGGKREENGKVEMRERKGGKRVRSMWRGIEALKEAMEMEMTEANWEVGGKK